MGLREFMNGLKERGDLVEIDDPVSSDLDACRIAREIERPILFKNLSGMRACINLISSRKLGFKTVNSLPIWLLTFPLQLFNKSSLIMPKFVCKSPFFHANSLPL